MLELKERRQVSRFTIFLSPQIENFAKGKVIICLFAFTFICFFSHFSIQPKKTKLDSIFYSPCLSNTGYEKGIQKLIPTLCSLSTFPPQFHRPNHTQVQSVNVHESRTYTAGSWRSQSSSLVPRGNSILKLTSEMVLKAPKESSSQQI